MDGDDPRRVCLYHNKHWRSCYNHVVNKLRRDIGGQHSQQIPRVICTCEFFPEPNEENALSTRQRSRTEITNMWTNVTQEDFTVAQEYFESFIDQQDPCEDFRGFLQSFYRRLQRCNMLTDEDTSARRFLYVLHRALEHRDFRFLRQPEPSTVQQSANWNGVIHLASLKPQDIGNFIGKRGKRLRHVALPRSKITIKIDADNQKVEASVICPERVAEEQKKKLLHQAGLIGESRRKHEQKVEEYKRSRQQAASAAAAADADDDDDEDDDDYDDDDDDEE